MAENKKSFVLYADLIHTVRKMPKGKQAELFMTILQYVNDENPVVEDLVVGLVWEPIKLQLKRDLVKYETFRSKQAENGKKGGRPQAKNETQNNPDNPSLFLETQKSITVTVNDNVTVNDINNSTPVFFESMPKDCLPPDENYYEMCRELVCRVKMINVDISQVKSLWPVFKIQNLTGTKYYADVGAVHSHFMNWIKKQDFEEGKIKQPERSNLSATVRKLNEQHAAKKQESATG